MRGAGGKYLSVSILKYLESIRRIRVILSLIDPVPDDRDESLQVLLVQVGEKIQIDVRFAEFS